MARVAILKWPSQYLVLGKEGKEGIKKLVLEKSHRGIIIYGLNPLVSFIST